MNIAADSRTEASEHVKARSYCIITFRSQSCSNMQMQAVQHWENEMRC